jgi:hypothetical protein
MERLFESLRSGAANVAGVTYQIGMSAWALIAGGTGSITGLDVVAITPEGFEDVDCELRSGGRLLIQTKDRGVGTRAIAMAELTEIVVHAAEALGSDGRLAIATNGRFGSSLSSTGFSATLADHLSASTDGAEIHRKLLDGLQRQLDTAGLTGATPESLISRTHLVTTGRDLAQQILVELETALDLHAALASLVRAELLRDLGDVAAQQRESTLATVVRRTSSDVDLLVTRIKAGRRRAELGGGRRRGRV